MSNCLIWEWILQSICKLTHLIKVRICTVCTYSFWYKYCRVSTENKESDCSNGGLQLLESHFIAFKRCKDVRMIWYELSLICLIFKCTNVHICSKSFYFGLFKPNNITRMQQPRSVGLCCKCAYPYYTFVKSASPGSVLAPSTLCI